MQAPSGLSSPDALDFCRRLQRFVDNWMDGDGHAILDPDLVLADVRATLPELELAMSALKQSFEESHRLTGGGDFEGSA